MTSPDALIANTMFAEQENSPLAALKSGAVHMSQPVLIWVLKLWLYKRAMSKDDTFLLRDKGVKRARTAPAPGAATVVARASQPAEVAEVVKRHLADRAGSPDDT